MDRMVWAGCLLLFLAGGVWFNVVPEFTWKKEVSVADFVGGVSAIAAAFAAYASWKAANISKASADDSKYFARAQLYMSHRKDFFELIDYVASELKVVFFRKNDLYRKLFPGNHYSGRSFDTIGNLDVVNEWRSSYAELVLITGQAPSDLALVRWIIECSNLSDSMHFAFPRLDDIEPELYLFVKTDPIQTQFSRTPARPVFLLGEVLNHLLSFCGHERIEPLLMDRHPFEDHYLSFFDRVDAGHSEHYVRHRVREPRPA